MRSDHVTPQSVQIRPLVSASPIDERGRAWHDAARLVLAAAVSVYFWPTTVAADRDHRELDVVASVNLMLGWTVLGWFASLAWAYRGRGGAAPLA